MSKSKKLDGGRITRRITDKDSTEVFIQVAHLIAQLNPDVEVTPKKYVDLVSNPKVILLGTFYSGQLVGIVSLFLLETFTRTTLLFEECVVDSRFRGRGIGSDLAREAIAYNKKSGLASRIEGTSNENNAAAWNAYMNGGFFDRRNKTFFWFSNR